MELCFSISSSVDSIDISPVSASCLRESGNLYFMHRPFSTLPPPSHHHHRPQCQVRHNRPNSQDWGKLWVICILWYRRQVICILCRNLELRIRQGRLLSYRRQWLRISAAILKLLSCWPFLKDGLKHQHHYLHQGTNGYIKSSWRKSRTKAWRWWWQRHLVPDGPTQKAAGDRQLFGDLDKRGSRPLSEYLPTSLFPFHWPFPFHGRIVSSDRRSCSDDWWCTTTHPQAPNLACLTLSFALFVHRCIRHGWKHGNRLAYVCPWM